MKEIRHSLPGDIERTSMSIIGEELTQRGITLLPENEAVVKRAIHATADFEYAENLRFTAGATVRGAAAMSAGRVIVTDTNMALAGISKKTMEKLGVKAVCLTGEAETEALSKELHQTRASAGMILAAERYPSAVFVSGNAPTALFALAELMGKGLCPALVIGVPVGFVNVVESKEEILTICERLQVPAIVAMGRKGGSNVAAAIVNALLYTAAGELDPAGRGWQG